MKTLYAIEMDGMAMGVVRAENEAMAIAVGALLRPDLAGNWTARRAYPIEPGRLREFAVRASVVRRFGADKPVSEVTVVPVVESAYRSSSTDEVTLQPGQWLEIVRHGAPDRWSKAVIRA